jgi:hypothetical protein
VQPRFSPVAKVANFDSVSRKQVKEVNLVNNVTVYPYIAYVLCDELPEGYGEALIDTVTSLLG